MHSIDPAPRARPRWRMRLVLTAMAALAVVALSACGGGAIPANAWDTATATPATATPAAGDPAVGAPATGDPPVVVRLDKQGRAKQDGVALFTPQGDQTEVDLRAVAYNLGRTQPVTIDSAECGDIDEIDDETVDWVLENMMDGFLFSSDMQRTVSVVDAPMEEILNGERTLHIRQEPNLAFIANACGKLLPGEAKTIKLTAVGASEQDGFASLIRAGGETHVNLWVDILPEYQVQATGDAFDPGQPANIYSGTCDALGAVVHTLVPSLSRTGWGSTVLAASFDELVGGPLALAMLYGPDDNTVTSCGNLDGSDDA